MAKAESKTILKAYSTVESKLPTLPLEDGQLIFVYDKKKIILDNHGVRTVYEQIQTIETEEQRNDLLAPIDSFYFVIETSILWRYSNGHWNQITTSPQEQIDRIATEGTKQVKAVRDEGQKVLQSIPEDFQTQMETKLNKQQGIENKGKVLVIGEDGNVSPGEVQSGGGDGIAIINTMSGESPLAIPDSAERVNKRLELGGKTEQVSTRGVNLWNKESKITFTATKQVVFDTPIPAGDYVVSANVATNDKDGAVCLMLFYYTDSGSKGANLTRAGRASAKITFTSDVKHVVLYAGQNANGSANDTATFADIQLEKGSTATAYEPYTGGKPSPSPEYPQEIKNSGKWNEETQKYEVDVKVTGKNLFNREKAKDVSKWTPCAFNANFAEIAVYVGTGSTVTASNNVKIDNPVYYYGVALKSSEDIKYFICYPGYPNSKDTHTFTATEDYIYVRCNKTSLNDVIGVCGGLQIEIGASRTDFEPYKEQTLTLTSDRPITKWDRLVEQGGQIGWLYTSKIDALPKTGYRYIETGYFSKGNVFTDSALNTTVTPGSQFFTCFSLANPSSKKGDIAWLYVNKPGTTDLRVRFADESINTAELFEKYMADKDMKILYETAQPEFVPLPQSEQNAIRALKTYYPTTVITADGGELDPDIKVTYTADTKNYVDNKFGKTINAMQTKLLELESRV